MIITLKIKLVYGLYAKHDWSCEIEIDENSDLEALHLAIQNTVDFDDDHLYEFYIARTLTSFDKKRFDSEEEFLDVKLSEVFPLPKNKKLFYWFDYGDDWKFQISKSRRKPKKPEVGVEYPLITSVSGKKPEQYPDFD